MPTPEISEGRKSLYYIGMILIVIGALSFGSVFISGALHFGDFSNFEAHGRSMMIRAFGGMAIMIVGAIFNNLGRLGLAGAGVVLDPKGAREDLKPWTKMAGGMIQDAVSEVEAVNKVVEHLGTTENAPAKVVEKIKVRCPACRALNDEDAKFCDQCGKEM